MSALDALTLMLIIVLVLALIYKNQLKTNKILTSLLPSKDGAAGCQKAGRAKDTQRLAFTATEVLIKSKQRNSEFYDAITKQVYEFVYEFEPRLTLEEVELLRVFVHRAHNDELCFSKDFKNSCR